MCLFAWNFFISCIKCQINDAADGTIGWNFDEGISKERKNEIGKEIRQKEDIATMRYVSAEEAWEIYKKDVFQGNEELLEGFEGNNPLKESDSYEITLKEVE